jgi:3-oxoacyl-[acyl-carrier protein] reductase
MSFHNTRIAIVGASGGIGSALARRLHAACAELLLLSRTPEKLAELSAELNTPAQTMGAPLGALTGIVNCAGSLLLKPAHLTTDEEWRQTLDTNLTTAFHTVRAGARAMMGTGGSIVLCATAAARAGFANQAALQASAAMHPRGRIGQPEEVASAIAWLLDPDNSWVTGQVLGVDGGLGSLRPR